MTTTKKQLKRIYLVIVVSIISFLAIQQFLLHLSITESKEYTSQINRAGKQRMLSQRIAKLCLLHEAGKNTTEEIRRTLNEWNTSHSKLLEMLGNHSGSGELLTGLRELTVFHEETSANVTCFLSGTKNPNSSECLENIILDSERFLSKMDHIVTLYDQESQRATQNITIIEYVMTFIAVLIIFLEIFIVFRPSSRIIGEQEQSLLEQLETIREQETKLQIHIKELTDSLNYAKKVQETILPSNNKFTEILSDSFILYLPKQIVAGDFYLLEELKSENDESDLLLLAVGDCTGHGVPGAMVSIICHDAINKAVKQDKLVDPAKILDRVNEYIRNKFSDETKGISDGMDISICCFNKTTRQLIWAGANLPLWIIRKNELIEYKPDKQPIGNFITNNDFTPHTIDLHENDFICLFSDGYSDQFGGELGKKLSRRQFQQLILKFDSGNLSAVQKSLKNAFEQWKGEHEQVDDVTILGVKF